MAFATFDALLEAVKAQIRHLLRGAANIAVTYMPSSEVNDSKPVKSLLTEGCVEAGVDFNARGHPQLSGSPGGGAAAGL